MRLTVDTDRQTHTHTSCNYLLLDSIQILSLIYKIFEISSEDFFAHQKDSIIKVLLTDHTKGVRDVFVFK